MNACQACSSLLVSSKKEAMSECMEFFVSVLTNSFPFMKTVQIELTRIRPVARMHLGGGCKGVLHYRGVLMLEGGIRVSSTFYLTS